MIKYVFQIVVLLFCVHGFGQTIKASIQDEELAPELYYIDSVIYADTDHALAKIHELDSLYYLSPAQKHKVKNRKAIVEYLIGNYTESIALFEEELYFAEQEKDTADILGALQNIAGIYGELGMNVEALRHHETSLNYIAHASPVERIDVLNNTGNTYINLKKFKNADSLFKLSLKESYREKDTFNLGIACGNLGYSNFVNAKDNNDQQLLKSAEIYLQKSLDYAEVVNDLYGVLFCSVQLAKLYLYQDQYEEAKPYLIRANELTIETQTSSERSSIAHGMYQFYRKKGDENLALQWLEEYVNLEGDETSDSIKSQILKVQANYYNHEIIRLYDAKIDSLNQLLDNKESSRIASENSNWLFIVIIVIMMLIIAGLVFKSSQRKNILDSVNAEIKQKSINLESANTQLQKNMQIALKLQQSAMPKAVVWERYFKDGFIYSYSSDAIPRHSLWIQRDNQKTLICLMQFKHEGIVGAVLCGLTHQKLQRAFSKINTPTPSEIVKDLNDELSQQLKELNIPYSDAFSLSVYSYKHNSRALSYVVQNQSLYQVNLTSTASGEMEAHGFTPLTEQDEEQQIILNKDTWLYFWTIPQENTDNFTSLIRQNLTALSPKSSLFQKRFIELELKDKGIPEDFCLVGFKS